jgi:ankyrin repeat protein
MRRQRHSRSVTLLLRLQYGWASLHLAAMHDNDKFVEVLVQAGADVNAADEVRHSSSFASRAALRL